MTIPSPDRFRLFSVHVSLDGEGVVQEHFATLSSLRTDPLSTSELLVGLWLCSTCSTQSPRPQHKFQLLCLSSGCLLPAIPPPPLPPCSGPEYLQHLLHSIKSTKVSGNFSLYHPHFFLPPLLLATSHCVLAFLIESVSALPVNLVGCSEAVRTGPRGQLWV